MSGRTALVTGATGAVGPSLVARLLAEGYTVRALSRTPLSPGLLDSAAVHIPGSITDAAAIHRALDGVDIVYHLAALLHIEQPTPKMAAAYQEINVTGTRLVAQAAAQAGVKRFVYFSTVKVYGRQQRQPVTEQETPTPVTHYARTKLEGERIVHTTPGLEAVTLRLSPVYGPRLRGSWARLVQAVARNRFIPIGGLRNVHSLSHVDDVAQAALLAAEHPDAPGRILNLVAHETPTLHAILQAIYAACGRKLPAARIPAPLALAGAFTLERGMALVGRSSPLPVRSLRQLIEDEAYSGTALRQLGFTPQVSINQGWPVGKWTA